MSGVSGAVDKTVTASMMIRTFQTTPQQTEEDQSQYCAAVTRDVDLFTVTKAGDAAATSEDSRWLGKYVAENFKHKHVVIDVDDHRAAVIEEVMAYCDCLVFVLRVCRNEIRLFKEWLTKQREAGRLTGKRAVILFNRYNPVIVKQKELAALLGIKPAYIYTMEYNEYFAWAAFNNKFKQFWNFVVKGDMRVRKKSAELDRLVEGLRSSKASGGAKIGKKEVLLGVKRVMDADAYVTPIGADNACEITDYDRRCRDLRGVESGEIAAPPTIVDEAVPLAPAFAPTYEPLAPVAVPPVSLGEYVNVVPEQTHGAGVEEGFYPPPLPAEAGAPPLPAPQTDAAYTNYVPPPLPEVTQAGYPPPTPNYGAPPLPVDGYVATPPLPAGGYAAPPPLPVVGGNEAATPPLPEGFQNAESAPVAAVKKAAVKKAAVKPDAPTVETAVVKPDAPMVENAAAKTAAVRKVKPK
jgi:hypothetical protein